MIAGDRAASFTVITAERFPARTAMLAHVPDPREAQVDLDHRFWAKVAKGSEMECWPWTAAKNPEGYGNFKLGGVVVRAHRVAYELAAGAIPAGLEIDHLCRNPSCVNPNHLEAVTHDVNLLRGNAPAARQARQTHCKRGHELTAGNLYAHRSKRDCRVCRRIRYIETRA
jgi:hypothetical protein